MLQNMANMRIITITGFIRSKLPGMIREIQLKHQPHWTLIFEVSPMWSISEIHGRRKPFSLDLKQVTMASTMDISIVEVLFWKPWIRDGLKIWARMITICPVISNISQQGSGGIISGFPREVTMC